MRDRLDRLTVAPKTCLVLVSMLSGLASLPAEYRTYTAKNGKTLEAEAISIRGANLKFRSAEGKIYEVPIASLSEPDQTYLAKWKAQFPDAVQRDVSVGATAQPGGSYQLQIENREPVPLRGAVVRYQVPFALDSPRERGWVAVPEVAAQGRVVVDLGDLRVPPESRAAGLLLRIEDGSGRILAEGRKEDRPGALDDLLWEERFAETVVELPEVREEKARPRIHDRDLRIRCRFQVPTPVADGVVFTQGGKFHGYSLYFRDGELHFAVRLDPETEPSRVSVPFPKALTSDSPVEVTCLFEQGEIGLAIKGGTSARKEVARRIGDTPIYGLVIGPDSAAGFSLHSPKIRFDGKISELRLDVWKEPRAPGEVPTPDEGRQPLLSLSLNEILEKPLTPAIKGRDFTLSCSFEGFRSRDRVAVVTHGGGQYGHVIYLREGRIWYAVRRSPEEEPARVSLPIPLGDKATVVAGLKGDSIHLTLGDGSTAREPIKGRVTGNPTAPIVLGPDDLKNFSGHCPTATFDGKVTALRLDVWKEEGAP